MSELVEVKQVPYKCDKCDHAGTVDAIIKRKPQKVIMEEGDDLSAIRKDIAELKAIKEKPVVEEKPKKEKVLVQSFEPKYHCPDGNCEIGAHKNENYREKPTKKCNDCDQYAPKRAKKCAWCGNDDFDELDDDQLSKLPEPKEREDHDHE